MKILYVAFDDPCEKEEWSSKEEAVRDTEGLNEALGWLIHETDTHIYLCPHNDCTLPGIAHDQFSSTLKINKNIIKKRKIMPTNSLTYKTKFGKKSRRKKRK